MKIDFENNIFPLFDPRALDDVKDPAPCSTGGSGICSAQAGRSRPKRGKFSTRPHQRAKGPWTEHDLIELGIPGSGVAAPGVVFHGGVFHMFIQTEFMRSGGTASTQFPTTASTGRCSTPR